MDYHLWGILFSGTVEVWANFNEVKILWDKYKPILSSRNFSEQILFFIQRFYMLLSHNADDRPCGGVSVLVREGTLHCELSLHTQWQAGKLLLYLRGKVGASNAIFKCLFYDSKWSENNGLFQPVTLGKKSHFDQHFPL